MQLFLAQQLFICIMYLFHSMIGKKMSSDMTYFAETLHIIDTLFKGKRRELWITRACNLMNSYR